MTRRLKSSFAFRIPKFQDGGTKYDETIGTYALPNVTIRAKRPQWAQLQLEYEKNFPKSSWIKQNLTPFARSLGNNENNYWSELDEEYSANKNRYVAQQIFKNNPQETMNLEVNILTD